MNNRIAAAFGALLLLLVPARAEANVLDRIKDIYDAPEKVQELESQYMETKAALDRQAAQLQETQREALRVAEEYARRQEELIGQNEQFRARNEALAAQNDALAEHNAVLTARMQQMEQDQAQRQSFTRKAIASVLIFAGAALLYLLSIRLWRYSVWRRQKQADWRP